MGTVNVVFGKLGVGGGQNNDVFYPNGSGEALTTDATTSVATTAAADDASTSNPHRNAVRIITSEDGYFAIGASPTAVKTTGRLLKADVEYIFACAAGDKVAGLDSA